VKERRESLGDFESIPFWDIEYSKSI